MNKNGNLAYRIWDIVYPVAMYYAAITIGMFVAQMIFGAGIENYMLCKTIGSLVALSVVYSDYKRDLMLTGRYGVKEPIIKDDIINVLLVIGITILLSVSLNNIISMSPLVSMSAEYENASNAFYSSNIWMELLGSALVTPILEELLHRGVVYGRLRRTMGTLPSVILSALIFAILHFNIVQFIYAFLLGIVFALFVEKSKRLYPAVIAHIVANAIAVVRTETGFLQGTVDGSVFAWVVSIVFCVVGIVGLIAYAREIFKKKTV